jgi:hypothetical protein
MGEGFDLPPVDVERYPGRAFTLDVPAVTGDNHLLALQVDLMQDYVHTRVLKSPEKEARSLLRAEADMGDAERIRPPHPDTRENIMSVGSSGDSVDGTGRHVEKFDMSARYPGSIVGKDGAL